MKSINPATEQLIAETKELTDSELNQKLTIADKAYQAWKDTTFTQRASLIRKLAKYLRAQKSKLAIIITEEVGKTLSASEAEIEKCAWTLDFYAENAEKFLRSEAVATDASESYVRFDPLGVILAVMPWNFPFWQVFRFAAPAIMAGNVGVLKHASNVQLSAQSIEDAFTKTGFPKGVFSNLAIGSSKVEQVIRDPRVKAVTLTGSEFAGSEVAKVSGQEIKKTVLELGGSDPFIVLKDADLNLAAESAVTARLQNNAGQSCISAKRFIVEKSVAEKFLILLTSVIEKLKVGDPKNPETNIGPLATEQILLGVDSQVKDSIKKGAKLVTGGKRAADTGYFYQPTILTNVKSGMPAYDEEVFGPVLAVITVKDEIEAIKVANDSQYGLGSTIFTKSHKKAKLLASLIESGNVFINSPVKSDPRLPFGGVKKSGYGRELSSYGIKEFVNVKTVWIK